MNKKTYLGILAAALMILLILDTKTAASGVLDGISMCLYSVIPSLFPFIILSDAITSSFMGKNILALRPIGRLCGIPAGSESLFMIGLVGGYPVGARCIQQAYDDNEISMFDAQRMLGFCNNAGPAFIFGIAAMLFDSGWYAWIIWGIQILSAIIVGALLPGRSVNFYHGSQNSKLGFTKNLEKSIKVMAVICGWIIFTKIIISYFLKWFGPLLPNEVVVFLCGLTELSNGIINLTSIQSPQLRFIFANSFLSFGGLCVWLQISSVSDKINHSVFFFGKILQTVIAVIISSIVSCFIFPDIYLRWEILALIILTSVCLSLLILKKIVAIQKKVLYNIKNTSRKELAYALS